MQAYTGCSLHDHCLIIFMKHNISQKITVDIIVILWYYIYVLTNTCCCSNMLHYMLLLVFYEK
jgi:hypothetical protein